MDRKDSDATERLAQNARQKSVFNLFCYLQKVCSQSEPLPANVVQASTSQGSLAKLEVKEENIIPMSLNTLKSIADDILGKGGWEKIDNLRMVVRRSTKPATSPKRLSPLAASRAHTSRIEARNDEQFQTRAVLYRAYSAAVDLLFEFADGEPERLAKITRLQGQYSSIFDLRLTGRR
jgi:hypothetical protein